jgi:2,5-diketo-D-gluconate reductase A
LEQWSALVEAQANGLARAIGVSNFGIEHLEEIRAAGLPTPQADQLELHPWAQKPALVDFLNSHQIVPIAYSSLVPLSTWRTDPGQDSAKTEGMRAEAERADSTFKVMAVKYGVTEAQLLLRWGVQQGFPVIPKSTDPARIRANADIFSFTIDDADLAAIAAMNRDSAVAWAMGDPTQAN